MNPSSFKPTTFQALFRTADGKLCGKVFEANSRNDAEEYAKVLAKASKVKLVIVQMPHQSKFFPEAQWVFHSNKLPSAFAKGLIGHEIKYLRNSDIDKSGRGYFRPQRGTVVDVIRREVSIDFPNNYTLDLARLSELVLIEAPEELA